MGSEDSHKLRCGLFSSFPQKFQLRCIVALLECRPNGYRSPYSSRETRNLVGDVIE